MNEWMDFYSPFTISANVNETSITIRIRAKWPLNNDLHLDLDKTPPSWSLWKKYWSSLLAIVWIIRVFIDMKREYVVVCLLCRVVVILQIITNASFVFHLWNILLLEHIFLLLLLLFSSFSTRYNVGSFFDKSRRCLFQLKNIHWSLGTTLFAHLLQIYFV